MHLLKCEVCGMGYLVKFVETKMNKPSDAYDDNGRFIQEFHICAYCKALYHRVHFPYVSRKEVLSRYQGRLTEAELKRYAPTSIGSIRYWELDKIRLAWETAKNDGSANSELEVDFSLEAGIKIEWVENYYQSSPNAPIGTCLEEFLKLSQNTIKNGSDYQMYLEQRVLGKGVLGR